jgi:hypothetical protein
MEVEASYAWGSHHLDRQDIERMDIEENIYAFSPDLLGKAFLPHPPVRPHSIPQPGGDSSYRPSIEINSTGNDGHDLMRGAGQYPNGVHPGGLFGNEKNP